MSAHGTPQGPIRQLELRRVPDERHAYFIDGIGRLRRDGGMFSSSFVGEAAGHSWRFAGRGLMQHTLEATDSNGAVIGRFVPNTIRRGGHLEWGARQLMLNPATRSRDGYVVREEDRDIIRIENRSWGRRPLKLTLIGADPIEPGLVLFTAFVVHRLADNDASAAASVVAVTAASSAC